MQSNNRRRGGRRSHDSASFPINQSSIERKVRQLCRQVHQRVDLVLAGELDDPTLDGLWVVDVQPEPGGAALLVTVAAPDDAELEPIRASLDAVRGRLRSEVAAAITRKKTPHLRFAVIPERAVQWFGTSGPEHTPKNCSAIFGDPALLRPCGSPLGPLETEDPERGGDD